LTERQRFAGSTVWCELTVGGWVPAADADVPEAAMDPAGG
jgi:hypothetical protein